MLDSILNLLSVLAVTLNVALGVLVFIRGPKKRLNIIYLFFSLVIAGWVLTNWLTYYLTDFNAITLNGHLTFGFATLIVPLFLTFEKYFPNEQQITRGWVMNIGLILVWLTGIILTYYSLFTKEIMGIPIVVSPHIVTLNQGPVHKYFFVYYIVFVGWAFLLHIQKMLAAKGVERQKLKVVLFGFSITALFGIMGNLVLVTFLDNPLWQAQVSHVGSLFTVVMVACMAYAILKYRLMDIQLAIQRSVARLLTFAIVFGAFAYVLLYAERNVESTSERNVTLLIIVTVIVVFVEPLRRWVYRFVDGLFDSQEQKRAAALQRLQLVATSVTQFTSLVTRVQEELQNVFGETAFFVRDERLGKLGELSLKDVVASRVMQSDILITNELPYRIEAGETSLVPVRDWLQRQNISAVLPIGKERDFIGMFVFTNQKVSFTSDQVEFLKDFRNQVQFAFASSYAYKLAVERIST